MDDPGLRHLLEAFFIETDISLEPATGAQPAAQTTGDGNPTVSLSAPAGAPGSTITVQGEGWPAGSRVIISLVPSDPPNYTVNSALVDAAGRFSAELIVPSDARWLEESPVPVLVTAEEGPSAQTALTIIAPPDNQPIATPAAPARMIVVAAVFLPDQPSLAESVPQLTTTANLNVRSGPGTTYPILGVLTLGQQAEIIGRNADATWWQIKFPGTKSGFGWVSAAYAQAANIANVPEVQAPPPPAQPAPTPTPQPGLSITDWRVEYFERSGEALIGFAWQRATGRRWDPRPSSGRRVSKPQPWPTPRRRLPSSIFLTRPPTTGACCST